VRARRSASRGGRRNPPAADGHIAIERVRMGTNAYRGLTCPGKHFDSFARRTAPVQLTSVEHQSSASSASNCGRPLPPKFRALRTDLVVRCADVGLGGTTADATAPRRLTHPGGSRTQARVLAFTSCPPFMCLQGCQCGRRAPRRRGSSCRPPCGAASPPPGAPCCSKP
jgi:hypothetical protein